MLSTWDVLEYLGSVIAEDAEGGGGYHAAVDDEFTGDLAFECGLSGSDVVGLEEDATSIPGAIVIISPPSD